MIMEVDMHTPASPSRSTSFGASATMRPATSSYPPSTSVLSTGRSAKRARSPVSDSPAYDRPQKRLLLAVGPYGVSQFNGGGIAVPQPTYADHAATGLLPVDDWVLRASGLRIASPLVAVDPALPEAVSRQGDLAEDAVMADEDVQMTSAPSSQAGLENHPPREEEPPEPYMASLLSPSSSAPSNFLCIPGQTGQTTEPHGHPYADGSRLRIPAIQVQNATPSPIGESPLGHPPTLSRAFSDGSLIPVQVIRRQRLTMGPRTNCEKCRMGVQGHWMHFD